MNTPLYPLILKPVFKEKPWGGRRLETLLGKNLPPDVSVGESWELAIRRDEKSTIANGPLAGKTLSEVGTARGDELYGISPVTENRFPLLIKFIDAQDVLSVQVHPDDKYVSLHEDTDDSGKTEMWYILHAEPGSGIIFGLKEGVTREEIRKALEEKTLKECFNEVPVKEGDVFFIPAGMVHAIGRGIVLAEIQQNSDITYRLYDWERLDSQGKPRDLHVEKALDVIDFSFTDAKKLEGVSTAKGRNKKTVLKKCPHFAVELLEINEETDQKTSDIFSVLSMLEGRSTIQWGAGEVNAIKGETVFLPACLADYRLLPDTPSRMLKTYIPLVP
ncbi:MAG: class I mannose-6-phosphate isomerase [Proteobacteria bacterium]|nr:class I mannose-6-phosphate isomerase [Pseudomonadota bacterium]